ncbi:MAG: ATP synthase F1 subunit delta [Bryobacteraceae bacterium]
MLSVVARRYAKALADVVTAPNSGLDAGKVLEQLRAIQAVIASSSDLRNAFASPAVSPSRKRAVIARIIDPMGVPRQVKNFLFVIIDHRRVLEFESIIDGYEHAVDDRLGFVRADITSARELSDAHRAALETQLTRIAGRQAKLRFAVDPSLVGGVVAKLGSTVYDGSVRGQLDSLRTKLGSR